MENLEKKSFWKKTEGQITMGLLAIGGILSLNYVDRLIQTMLTIAQNTLLLGVTLCGIGLLVFLLTSKEVQSAVSIFWQVMLRKSLGWAIEMDPINILKIKIQEAYGEVEKMFDEIKNFRMEVGKIDNRIQTNTKVAEEKFEKAAWALKNNEKETAENESAYAAKLIEMNQKKLIPLKDQMESAVSFLEKLRKNLKAKTDRTKNELEIQEIEFNTMKSGRNAMQSALRAYQGNPDKRMIFEMTAEHLDNEIGKMMGEIRTGVEMTRDFMKESDLENGQFSEKGLKMLQQYQAKGLNGLLEKPAEPQLIVLPQSNQPGKSSYNSLLD